MFEQVVFAGGGHRCWWQAGFWDAASGALALRPQLIAGVSAGAATACLLYANDSREALRYYEDSLPANARNAYWGNALKRGKKVFPHNTIYREALRHLIGGLHFARLRACAPEIRVQFARLPRWLGPRSAVAVGLAAYNLEKYTLKSLHPRFGKAIGFRSEIARVQDCENEDDLISLIIASSCTPPFTPIEYRNGRPTLDGGLVDNVPVDAVEAGRSTLVLTTRRYPGLQNVFRRQGRVYVQPSEKAPVSSWDYASVARYRATYELGLRDGEAFIKMQPRP
jgi:predicted acylesterase/phospholipase RssA